MSRYTTLMEKADKAIKGLFRVRAGVELTTVRNALLIPDRQQANSIDDLDLATTLVVK